MCLAAWLREQASSGIRVTRTLAQTPTTSSTSSATDKFKLLLGIALVIAGIVFYYVLADQQLLIRVAVVIAGVVAGAAVALSSAPGQEAWKFTTSARTEVRKVVWPTKQETTQVTIFVIIAVFIVGILLWLMDWASFHFIYDLILDARLER